MAWDYDKIKAQLFFIYLLRASKKFHERHMAKEELAVSLKKISKFKVSKEFKKEIEELKQKIDNAMQKQARLVSKQRERNNAGEELKEKVFILEKKLGQYIKDRKTKSRRIEELEKKIKERQNREQEIMNIKGELEGVETVYDTLKESGQMSPEQLLRLENRISSLKLKLEKNQG